MLFRSIAVYDEESDSFSHWTKKDGLISNSIFSMVEDNNKNIWAVSANGISIWDYTTKSWRQYLDHTRLRVSFALKNRIVELSEVKMQLESVNVKLETLAKKDGLTGVNNRRALTTELKQRFEEAVLLFEPIAALMIDIDFFKLYNDYYGHQKGDEALIAVARDRKSVV